MKKILICLILLLFAAVNLIAQTKEKGYIIEIEGTSVYLDYTSKDVKVGDRLQVMSISKVIVHPITKQQIVKEGEVIATLEITEVQENYSVAGHVYPGNAIAKISVGQKVSLPGNATANVLPIDGKINVAIADATVNDVVGTGYFGNYVADLLMAEMMNCDKIRLIDRSILNAQIDEANLSDAGYINANRSILKGQIAGVQNMIQLTMQCPDVTNITTGIPIKSFISAAGALAGAIGGVSKNMTKGLIEGGVMSSNVRTAKLKAAVSLTARVVDVQTGEILFMCTGNGNAQGDSQLELEEGALGGLQINGGVDGFKQTVTGKAVAMAYRKIGGSLKSYYNGETTQKVMKSDSLYSGMNYKNGEILMGANKLTDNEIKEAFGEKHQLYFDFKKGKNQKKCGGLIRDLGGAGFCFFFIDFITGSKNDYYNSDNNEPKYVGGIIDWHTSSTVPILISSVFAATCFTGYLLHKSGTIKIKQSINTYNTNLHKTSYKAEYNIRLSQGGLALRVTF